MVSVGQAFHPEHDEGQPVGLLFGDRKTQHAKQAAEKVIYFVIPNKVRNLSLI
jgi:hypothetical protein